MAAIDALRLVRELHHDLRQPLAAIRALAEAAGAQQGVPGVVADCLDRISQEASDLLAMCRHVLERPIVKQGVPVDHLARDVAETCRWGSTCRITVDVEPALLVTELVELRRALVNLVDNALRAAGPTGEVVISVRGEVEGIRVAVSDSGPGFGKGQVGSASIGLAIAERLVRRHGGRVEVGRGVLGGAEVALVFPDPVDHSDRTGLQAWDRDALCP